MNDVNRGAYILIADDDLDDIEMLSYALTGLKKNVTVESVDNGQRVLERLRHVQTDTKLAVPCVLVMDINMPRMDGRETVVALKTDDTLKNLPVLLFSTAKTRTDELFAEKWNVRFSQKPDTLQGLDDVAKMIIEMCSSQP